jgi:hypothetical protein
MHKKHKKLDAWQLQEAIKAEELALNIGVLWKETKAEEFCLFWL